MVTHSQIPPPLPLPLSPSPPEDGGHGPGEFGGGQRVGLHQDVLPFVNEVDAVLEEGNSALLRSDAMQG
jgi:hypothetical protein